MMPAKCGSCDAPILTVNKRPIPLDFDPVDAGNIRLTGLTVAARNGRRGPECEVIVQGDLFVADDGIRYLPHHATCPDADKWKGKS